MAFKGWTSADIERLQNNGLVHATTSRAKITPPPQAWEAATPNAPKTKAQPEYQIQAAFVREMSVKHPAVLVFSDTAAHIKKTQIQQVRANALSSPNEKQPDVFIAKAVGRFHGVFFEFKAESPYKADGVTLKKNPHIEAQARTMAKLENEGYFCAFVLDAGTAVGIFEKLLKS